MPRSFNVTGTSVILPSLGQKTSQLSTCAKRSLNPVFALGQRMFQASKDNFGKPPSRHEQVEFLHVDGYMNIAMEQTEEYVNGQLKNKYGDDIIQNNVLYICTSKRTLADEA
uniref:LSM domain-containing protein n=1 Tax=Fagus sylvatica TaxID=28930 RepID=A0A2N9HBL0_FAGSY